ncbi:MAG: hydrogenase formation protein HypD [Hyphomonas sp.]|uniref:hydrogenase formation protein HypD n=1 Tax=Hyphomonas sp. TaxID=87 RepID=UPI00352907B1
MKYVDEFRDPAAARNLAASIRAEIHPDRDYRFMEFCGGHTHALCRFGLEDLLPGNIRMIHGPGCPVCVLPTGRLDMAISLALSHPDVILCTYGDLMRVPASKGDTLRGAKARGADIRMIYSPAQAVDIAAANPDRQVVFMAIGFETTTPPTAASILAAEAKRLTNFTVLCNHVLTPAAIDAIMTTADGATGAQLDGFIGPGNVSTIIGAEPYEAASETWHKPIVISGFEPNDLLQAILMLVRQVNRGETVVENAFARAVRPGGNTKAQDMCGRVFTIRNSFEWRGLGEIPGSALRLAPAYAAFDAEARFGIDYVSTPDHKACECAAILRGEKAPRECKVFATACTPEHPLGSCMVSPEGACAAHYLYGRFRKAPEPSPAAT